MLLRFEVSNYRSILDPVELSMIAVDEDRAATCGTAPRFRAPLGAGVDRRRHLRPERLGQVHSAWRPCLAVVRRSHVSAELVRRRSPHPASGSVTAARTGPRPSRWTSKSTVFATATGWRSTLRLPCCTRACTATPSGGGERSSNVRATTNQLPPRPQQGRGDPAVAARPRRWRSRPPCDWETPSSAALAERPHTDDRTRGPRRVGQACSCGPTNTC